MNRRKIFYLILVLALFFSWKGLWAAKAQESSLPSDSELDDALDFLNEGEAPEEIPAESSNSPLELDIPTQPSVKSVSPESSLPRKEKVVSREPEEPVLKEAAPEELLNSATAALEQKAERLFDESETVESTKLEKEERVKKPTIATQRSSSEAAQKYSFVDNLGEAEAVIFDPQKHPEVSGVWKNNQFTFKGYENELEIKKASFKLDAGQQEGISIKLMPGRMHILKFRDVPPGSGFSLRYNLASATNAPNPIFAYLRIFVGDKELKRIQISTKDPWKSYEIDLGILSMMNRKVTTTFEILPERAKGLTLSLIVQTKK